jgi:hypothetical protein
MGWLEFLAWTKAMRTQKEGAKPDPYRWTPQDRAWFDEQRERRRAERGF